MTTSKKLNEMLSDTITSLSLIVLPNFEIGFHDRRQILLGGLAPELEQLKKQGVIDRWALAAKKVRGPVSSTKKKFVYDLLVWQRGEDSGPVIGRIMKTLGGHGISLAHVDGHKGIVAHSILSEKKLADRYGSNLVLISEFLELNTHMFLDSLELDEMLMPKGNALRILLASDVFIIKCFGLSKNEMSDGLRQFARFNCERRGITGAKFEDYLENREKDVEHLLGNTALQKFLLSLDSGKEKFGKHLEAFGPRCREIGTGLKAARDTLPEKYYYSLAVWNNFIHLHMLILGADNDTEITVHLISAGYLEKTGYA